MSLSFISSNWLRKYPFKATASTQDSSSAEELPIDIIVGCKLSSVVEYASCYISKVYLHKGIISIELHSNNLLLGFAKGTVTSDNQVFVIESQQPFFSGCLITGNKTQIVGLDRVYNFTATTGALEDSVITCYPRPCVPKLIHGSQSLAGHVKLALSNVDASVGQDSINFSVITPLDIISKKDYTSALLTCPNPVINSINGVEPSKGQASQGNIDIYGIAPVTISVAPGGLEIGTADIQLADVCKPVNIPPMDTSNKYHEEINESTTPEWKDWPQFNK